MIRKILLGLVLISTGYLQGAGVDLAKIKADATEKQKTFEAKFDSLSKDFQFMRGGILNPIKERMHKNKAALTEKFDAAKKGLDIESSADFTAKALQIHYGIVFNKLIPLEEELLEILEKIDKESQKEEYLKSFEDLLAKVKKAAQTATTGDLEKDIKAAEDRAKAITSDAAKNLLKLADEKIKAAKEALSANNEKMVRNNLTTANAFLNSAEKKAAEAPAKKKLKTIDLQELENRPATPAPDTAALRKAAQDVADAMKTIMEENPTPETTESPATSVAPAQAAPVEQPAPTPMAAEIEPAPKPVAKPTPPAKPPKPTQKPEPTAQKPQPTQFKAATKKGNWRKNMPKEMQEELEAAKAV